MKESCIKRRSKEREKEMSFGEREKKPERKRQKKTTLSTASVICYTVTATCRYGGRVGTGLCVLWVAYATHSTLTPVPTLPP
jgi:hypothetical protein